MSAAYTNLSSVAKIMDEEMYHMILAAGMRLLVQLIILAGVMCSYTPLTIRETETLTSNELYI